jgi:hypothetical protein
MSQANASCLRIRVVRQLFQQRLVARLSQAKRFSTPCWISDARSATSHFSEDVSRESLFFENQRRKLHPQFVVRSGWPCWGRPRCRGDVGVTRPVTEQTRTRHMYIHVYLCIYIHNIYYIVFVNMGVIIYPKLKSITWHTYPYAGAK